MPIKMYNSAMDNPWRHLQPKAPYILLEDMQDIASFNEKAAIEHRIVMDILPEPFLGNISDAKVILLNLNPGFSEKDLFWHTQSSFISENRKNLQHESNPPFYLLNTTFRDSGGFLWWHAHLKQFISLFGLNVISRTFMCIEFFPYHSKRYKQMPVIPSQGYSFHLVREAMKRRLPVIVMRGKRLWTEGVPELSAYPFICLNSAQNVTISKNNLPRGIFDQIVNLLSE